MMSEEMDRRMKRILKKQERISRTLQQVGNIMHKTAERQRRSQEERDKLKAHPSQFQMDSLNQSVMALLNATGDLRKTTEEMTEAGKRSKVRTKEVIARMDKL